MTHRVKQEADNTPLRRIGVGGSAVVVCVVWAAPLNRPAVVVENGDWRPKALLLCYSYAGYDAVELL